MSDSESQQVSSYEVKRGHQYFATLAANLGAFALGTVNGWTSPGLPDMEIDGALGGLKSDSNEAAWIGSLASLACFFAVYPSAFLMQKIGRQKTMVFSCVPFIIGWGLMTFPVNIWMFYVGRFITGFSSGTFSVAAPVFIGEFAEEKIRGALGSGFQFMIVTGILFAFAVGAFVPWNWLAGICAFPPLVCLIMLLFVPESPRYLISKGQLEEAAKSLMWYRGTQTFEYVEPEFRLVHKNVEENMANSASLKDLFRKDIMKPMLLGVAMLVFQQLSGIDAVTFYTVDIFDSADAGLDPNVSTIIVGVVQVIFNGIAIVAVDRVGRRVLLLYSDLVLVISLGALGLYFHLQEYGNVDSLGWLPLVSLVAYVAAFSIGIGPIAWMYVGELLPNHVIGIASPIATSSLWILSFLITFFFNDMRVAMGSNGAFWFFSAATILGTLFVFFLIPETKGKTLDEVQEFINGKKPPKWSENKENNNND